jgi:hypothetical protein
MTDNEIPPSITDAPCNMRGYIMPQYRGLSLTLQATFSREGQHRNMRHAGATALGDQVTRCLRVSLTDETASKCIGLQFWRNRAIGETLWRTAPCRGLLGTDLREHLYADVHPGPAYLVY